MVIFNDIRMLKNETTQMNMNISIEPRGVNMRNQSNEAINTPYSPFRRAIHSGTDGVCIYLSRININNKNWKAEFWEWDAQ